MVLMHRVASRLAFSPRAGRARHARADGARIQGSVSGLVGNWFRGVPPGAPRSKSEPVDVGPLVVPLSVPLVG